MFKKQLLPIGPSVILDGKIDFTVSKKTFVETYLMVLLILLLIAGGIYYLVTVNNSTPKTGTLNISAVPSEAICVDQLSGAKMNWSEAEKLAQTGECQQGKLMENHYCNENTGTWWVDLDIKDSKNCNPACVVWVKDKKVEINWRCTGLNPQ